MSFPFGLAERVGEVPECVCAGAEAGNVQHKVKTGRAGKEGRKSCSKKKEREKMPSETKGKEL